MAHKMTAEIITNIYHH